jgi:hypothetical protein
VSSIEKLGKTAHEKHAKEARNVQKFLDEKSRVVESPTISWKNLRAEESPTAAKILARIEIASTEVANLEFASIEIALNSRESKSRASNLYFECL